MLSQIVCFMIGLVLLITIYQYVSDNFNIKEPLETKKKDKKAQAEQAKLQLAKSKATPAEINANNVAYLERTFDDIQKSTDDIKDMLIETITNLKDGCCDINKYNKLLMCARPGGKNLRDCKNKNPCRPCNKNDKFQTDCCPKISVPACK